VDLRSDVIVGGSNPRLRLLGDARVVRRRDGGAARPSWPARSRRRAAVEITRARGGGASRRRSGWRCSSGARGGGGRRARRLRRC